VAGVLRLRSGQATGLDKETTVGVGGARIREGQAPPLQVWSAWQQGRGFAGPPPRGSRRWRDKLRPLPNCLKVGRAGALRLRSVQAGFGALRSRSTRLRLAQGRQNDPPSPRLWRAGGEEGIESRNGSARRKALPYRCWVNSNAGRRVHGPFFDFLFSLFIFLFDSLFDFRFASGGRGYFRDFFLVVFLLSS